MQVTAIGYSQKTFTITMENTTLEKVMDHIKKNSEYYFLYKNSDINAINDLNMDISNASIEEILTTCLQGTNLSFSVDNNLILIKKTEPLVKSDITEEIVSIADIGVKGKITDSDGTPLPGATIMEKGTLNGVISDKNGNYSFEVANNAILKISYIGFETQEIQVGVKTLINVVLKPSVNNLDEVVVTGYQTLSVNKNTGATKTVKAEVFERKGNSNVLESLEGQVAGLGMSFDPNEEGKKKFDIRGISTISGNKMPLIVVDGFALEGDVSSINPYDIKTVTVLKDAAATSIYGARAANGVIVITTKKGKKGNTKIEYRNSFSYEAKMDLAYRLNRVNSKDLVELQRISGLNSMVSFKKSNVDIATFNGSLPTPVFRIMLDLERNKISKEQAMALFKNLSSKDNTEQWKKAFFQPKLEMQHNLSVSGGGDKNTFRASLNYTKNQRQFVGSKSDKVRFNIINNYVFSKKINMDIIANVAFTDAISTPVDRDVLKRVFSYEMIADNDGNPLPLWETAPYSVFNNAKKYTAEG
jgi:TonB-dependent SusC/RagA subfamily outer membrane receptor